MSSQGKIKARPPGLVAIVAYKVFVTITFSITALALLFTLGNYQKLEDFASTYVLEGKYRIIDWVMDKLLDMNPRTLKFAGLAAGIYAIVSGIEAIGLWQQKAWAHLLVIFLVGISIAPEIYELLHGATLVKFVVFLINIAMFVYLVLRFPRGKHSG